MTVPTKLSGARTCWLCWTVVISDVEKRHVWYTRCEPGRRTVWGGATWWVRGGDTWWRVLRRWVVVGVLTPGWGGSSKPTNTLLLNIGERLFRVREVNLEGFYSFNRCSTPIIIQTMLYRDIDPSPRQG